MTTTAIEPENLYWINGIITQSTRKVNTWRYKKEDANPDTIEDGVHSESKYHGDHPAHNSGKARILFRNQR